MGKYAVKLIRRSNSAADSMLSHANRTGVMWMSARCNCIICGVQTNLNWQFAKYAAWYVPSSVERASLLPPVTQSLIFYA